MTLHFKIEKISMTELRSGSKDYVKVLGLGMLDANQTTVYTNFTPPPWEAWLQLGRDVKTNDLMTMKPLRHYPSKLKLHLFLLAPVQTC